MTAEPKEEYEVPMLLELLIDNPDIVKGESDKKGYGKGLEDDDNEGY